MDAWQRLKSSVIAVETVKNRASNTDQNRVPKTKICVKPEQISTQNRANPHAKTEQNRMQNQSRTRLQRAVAMAVGSWIVAGH